MEVFGGLYSASHSLYTAGTINLITEKRKLNLGEIKWLASENMSICL